VMVPLFFAIFALLKGLPRPETRLVDPDCRRKRLIKTIPLCDAAKAAAIHQTMVLIKPIACKIRRSGI
jgi:hypothetical protein